MAARRKRGNVSSTLLAFGRQLRRYRDAAGLSQERAGSKAHVSGAYVGMVETGRTRCTKEFAAAMDQVLETGGSLLPLWGDLVMDAAFPTWFDWPMIESEAVMLQSYSLSVVHGLLQTKDYASALLRGNMEAVEARMGRQSILTRNDPRPPAFALLLDEGVLYRKAGSPEIMREQLESLAGMVSERLTIQIIPAAAEHAGNSGSFNIATLDDRSEVGYAESAARGLTISEPDDLATMSDTLMELRALALPVDMSIDLIRRTVEKKWT